MMTLAIYFEHFTVSKFALGQFPALFRRADTFRAVIVWCVCCASDLGNSSCRTLRSNAQRSLANGETHRIIRGRSNVRTPPLLVTGTAL